MGELKMTKRKQSILQKKIIFIIGMGLLFLIIALGMYIDPFSEGRYSYLDLLAVYIGLCTGFVIHDLSRNLRIISISVGMVFILLTGWFITCSIFDTVELLLGYLISYWLANMFSKVDIFGLYSTKKKEDDNLDEKRDGR